MKEYPFWRKVYALSVAIAFVFCIGVAILVTFGVV